MNDKSHDIYGLDRARHLDHALAEAGVGPDEIDIVLASHLHFDHVGGATVRDASGHVVPRFPKARHLVSRGEWEAATHPPERTRGSYLTANFVPLFEAGVVDLIDGDDAVMPGVRVQRSGGHTTSAPDGLAGIAGRRARSSRSTSCRPRRICRTRG